VKTSVQEDKGNGRYYCIAHSYAKSLAILKLLRRIQSKWAIFVYLFHFRTIQGSFILST